MLISYLLVGISAYLMKYFYELREASLIKWEWDRYHRMFLFWSAFTLLRMLSITTNVVGLTHINSMIQTTSLMLTIYILYSYLYG